MAVLVGALVLAGVVFLVVSGGDDDDAAPEMTAQGSDADDSSEPPETTTTTTAPPPTTARPTTTTTSTTVPDTFELWRTELGLAIATQFRLTQMDDYDVIVDPDCILTGMEADMGAGRLEDVADEASTFEIEDRVWLSDVLDSAEWVTLVESTNHCLDDFDGHIEDELARQLRDARDDPDLDLDLTDAEADCIAGSMTTQLTLHEGAAFVFEFTERDITPQEEAAMLVAGQSCI